MGLTDASQNIRASTAPCCIVCHENITLSLGALGLLFGVPNLERNRLIWVITHDENLAATGVVGTRFSGSLGPSHG